MSDNHMMIVPPRFLAWMRFGDPPWWASRTRWWQEDYGERNRQMLERRGVDPYAGLAAMIREGTMNSEDDEADRAREYIERRD